MEKYFHNKMLLISLIAILFVPMIYAGMFLWSFWNPYGHLDRLPVAIVNNDVGATIDGKKTELGNDLVSNLLDSKEFKFKELSLQEAKKGLNNRDYYMIIKIPKDFSQNAGTLLKDNPEQMKIIYQPNEGNNFLGGQIGNSAVEKIRAEVNKQVSATYAKQLFANIKKMGNGYGDAADGAGKLEQGSNKLTDGASQLNDGIESAKDGANQLNDGAKSAATGSATLKDGIDSATNGASQLKDGAKSATSGAQSLNTGITSATDGSGQLQTGSSRFEKWHRHISARIRRKYEQDHCIK